MDEQARTDDTELVKSIEIAGGSKTLPWWLGEEGKDDRKQNTLASWVPCFAGAELLGCFLRVFLAGAFMRAHRHVLSFELSAGYFFSLELALLFKKK